MILIGTEEFRKLWLPYCVKKMNDQIGGWIVLNRKYKPLGFRLDLWACYENVPRFQRIRSIPLPQQRKIFHGSLIHGPWLPNEMIWLYHDGCIPTRSLTNWDSYQSRLRVLSSLDLFDVDQ